MGLYNIEIYLQITGTSLLGDGYRSSEHPASLGAEGGGDRGRDGGSRMGVVTLGSLYLVKRGPY